MPIYFLLLGLAVGNRYICSLHSKTTEVTLDFAIPKSFPKYRDGFTHLTIQDATSVPCIRDAGIIGNIGRPQLPVIRKFIEIPETGLPDNASLNISAKVIQNETKLLKYPIYPHQPPIPKNPVSSPAVSGSRLGGDIQHPVSSTVIDKNYYLKDEFGPDTRAKIVYIGKIRGHRIAVLEVYPIIYNPKKNIIDFASQIQVTIKFNAPDWNKTISELQKYSVLPYENWLKNIIVNYDYYSQLIQNSEFRIQNSKNSHIGYLIITPDEWYNHILPLASWKRQKGFFTNVAKLSQTGFTIDEIRNYIKNAYYDTLQVPPTYVLLVGDVDKIGYFTGEGLEFPPTDLNFSLMEDTDYFPDVYVSRFSVADTFQLDSLVEKTIKYERNNWAYGEDWCNKAYFIASVDPDSHQIAESTHIYCMEKCRANGMLCDSLWLYSSSGTGISTAINEGRTFAIYSGHGSSVSWGDPGFGVNDVHNLVNIDKTPFIGSFACSSGDYTYSECFSESWLRTGSRGAIAHLASSVSSYWSPDDILQRRLFDALIDSGETWVMGAVNFAKMKFLQYYGDVDISIGYFEQYNLIGDGSIDIYSSKPESIIVEYPDSILGSLHISVKKEGGIPVKGALICARTDTIFTGYTDTNGELTLNIATAQKCTLWLTVTGHNIRTYEGFTIACSTGIEDSLYPSEKILIYQNTPNPFSTSTKIFYWLSDATVLRNSKLTIYDISGRVVKTIPLNLDQKGRFGEYIMFYVVWDGKNDRGKKVHSGIYFYTLKIGESAFTKKMVVL